MSSTFFYEITERNFMTHTSKIWYIMKILQYWENCNKLAASSNAIITSVSIPPESMSVAQYSAIYYYNLSTFFRLPILNVGGLLLVLKQQYLHNRLIDLIFFFDEPQVLDICTLANLSQRLQRQAHDKIFSYNILCIMTCDNNSIVECVYGEDL